MDPNVISKPEISTEYDEHPSMAHLVLENLSKAGDQVLLVSGISSDELTAKELLDRSVLCAMSLKAIGIKPGDVISIVSENRFEFAYILFGSILLNCSLAPINLTYSEREMTHAFGLSKPKIIFMSPFAAEKVVKVSKSLNFVQKVILFEDENPFGDSVVLYKDFLSSPSSLDAPYLPTPVDKHKSVSIILCSSGTTGLPKGVQLSQDNLFVVTRFCKNTVMKLVGVDHEPKVMLGLIPWFHAFGLTTLTGMITSTSGKIVLLPKFEEGLFLSCIENYRCNVLFLVPPLMVFLAKHPMVDGFNLDSMRIIICGAAPLSKDVEKAVYDRMKNKKLTIRQGYGMSEMSLSVLLQKSMFKPGSVGDLNEGSIVKVIDENGKSLGPNKRGELCFKGNQLMIGYIGDDKATKDTIDKEGWSVE